MAIFHRHNNIDAPKLDYGNINDVQVVDDTGTGTDVMWSPNKIDSEIKERLDDTDFVSIIASDLLVDSANTEQDIPTTQTAYAKEKDITFNEVDGTIRIKWDMRTDDGNDQVNGQIYLNDTPEAGTEETETTGTYTTFSHDVAVSQGDEVQLYVKWVDNAEGSSGAKIRNFRLYYTKQVIKKTAGTVNLD